MCVFSRLLITVHIISRTCFNLNVGPSQRCVWVTVLQLSRISLSSWYLRSWGTEEFWGHFSSTLCNATVQQFHYSNSAPELEATTMLHICNSVLLVTVTKQLFISSDHKTFLLNAFSFSLWSALIFAPSWRKCGFLSRSFFLGAWALMVPCLFVTIRTSFLPPGEKTLGLCSVKWLNI